MHQRDAKGWHWISTYRNGEADASLRCITLMQNKQPKRDRRRYNTASAKWTLNVATVRLHLRRGQNGAQWRIGMLHHCDANITGQHWTVHMYWQNGADSASVRCITVMQNIAPRYWIVQYYLLRCNNECCNENMFWLQGMLQTRISWNHNSLCSNMTTLPVIIYLIPVGRSEGITILTSQRSGSTSSACTKLEQNHALLLMTYFNHGSHTKKKQPNSVSYQSIWWSIPAYVWRSDRIAASVHKKIITKCKFDPR